MKRDLYDVVIVDDADFETERRIEVYHADRVLAEREARRLRMPPLGQNTAQEYIALWVWCAWRRLTGTTEGEFEDWLPRLIVCEPVKVVARLDPTQQEEPTVSPSSWPVSSVPAPTTG